jgi:hypothetical protein
MRYERVQRILENDLVLKKLLGPRNCPVETRLQTKVFFSEQTIRITQAIHSEGLDAHQLPKDKILLRAARALNFLPASDGNALAPRLAPAVQTNTAPASKTPDGTASPVLPKRRGRPRKVITEALKIPPPKPERTGKRGRPRTKPEVPAAAKTSPRAKRDGGKNDAPPPAKPISANSAPEESPMPESELPPEKRVAVEVTASRTPITLPDTVEDFTTQIRQRVQNQLRQALEDTVAIGEAFLAAVQKYGQNLNDLAARAELSYNTVTQYVKVAKRFGTSSKSWARAQLPPSADSLVRLARLEPGQLEDAVRKGKVKPDMGRKEVKSVLREYRPVNQKTAEIDVGVAPCPQTVFDPVKRWKQFCAVLEQEYAAWPAQHREYLADQLRTFADLKCS